MLVGGGPRTIWLMLAAALAVAGGDRARADTFVLHNGGQIRGQWLNRDQRPLRQYQIVTETGGRLTLGAIQVREVLPRDETLEEYERIAPGFPDTVDGQWQLAEWCRTHKLVKPRQAVLAHLLELDPDHAGARRGLGYSQVRGRWELPKDVLLQRGYELSGRQWRYPQEIELEKQRQTRAQAEKEWLVRLTRCREQLGTDKAQAATQELAEVRDPQAVPALTLLLKREPLRPVKLLYIQVLAAIGTSEAVQTLIQATLQDPDEEIFYECLDHLVKQKPPHVAEQYAQVLKDANNVRVNRAACALGRLGDQTVLSPLIDALITTHRIIIPGKSDSYTASFLNGPAGGGSGDGSAGPVGGNSFSAGDSTKVIPRTVTNQQVLEALIRLSGGTNFGFDQQAWRSWLAVENRRTAPQLNARRD